MTADWERAGSERCDRRERQQFDGGPGSDTGTVDLKLDVVTQSSTDQGDRAMRDTSIIRRVKGSALGLAAATCLATVALLAPAASSGATGSPTQLPVQIVDNFKGMSLNGAVWVTDQQSDGTSQGVQGGALVLTASSATSSGFHDGILTRCLASGDFDARIRFTLLNWPADDNVSLAVNAPNLGNAFVEDAFGGDVYGLFVQPSGFITIPASAHAGELWLSRRGDLTSAYTRSHPAGQWQAIGQFSGPTSDTWVGVAIWNISAFGGQPVSVRVDSFELDATALHC